MWTRIKKFSTALKSDYLCWFWGLIYCRIGPNPNICIYTSVYSYTLYSLGSLTGQNYFLVLMRRRMLIVYDSSPMLYMYIVHNHWRCRFDSQVNRLLTGINLRLCLRATGAYQQESLNITQDSSRSVTRLYGECHEIIRTVSRDYQGSDMRL